MKIVVIQASQALAKEIVIASMQGKDIDVFGMLTTNVIQADGQKMVSSTYRTLNTRISIEDFTANKEDYLKRNVDASYYGMVIHPDFKNCEEISKQLKLKSGCINLTIWIDL